MSDTAKKVAEFWSRPDLGGVFSPAVYWLANDRVQLRYQSKAVAGRPAPHWIDDFADHYLGDRRPVERLLSLGCGRGDLERHFQALGAFQHMEGIDIAPGLIDEARRHARSEGLENVSYRVENFETAPFGEDRYDVAVFNGSLHHVFDLEGVLDRIAAALKPDGLLLLNEYVGPDRFAFSEREAEVIRAAYALIPRRYRVSLAEHNFGAFQAVVPLPDSAEVERGDPSESVRSSEIPERIAERFEIIEHNPIGGTILHFGLINIAGHFRQEDPASIEVLEMLFDLEDRLIEMGEISSHFAHIVARRRPVAG